MIKVLPVIWDLWKFSINYLYGKVYDFPNPFRVKKDGECIMSGGRCHLFQGISKNCIVIITIFVCISFLFPQVSAAMQLVEGENDLGLLKYSETPKTWIINIDSGDMVDVGVYTSTRAEPSRYGGWKAYLKINGEKIWEHTGDSNIKDYISGTTVKESDYRNQYYDLTSKFHPGENTITYYHFTGDGDHGIKIRYTKGAIQTPTTVSTPVPTPTLEIATCEPGYCGIIETIKYNGVEVSGVLTSEQKEIGIRINEILDDVDPIYGSRPVDREITLDIVTAIDASPVWSETRNLMQVPSDANDLEIAHELGHYNTYGIMMANGGNPAYVPLWFREGLAEHIASTATGTKMGTRQEFFTGNLETKGSKDLIDSAAVNLLDEARSAAESEDLDSNTYGASATFVEFLDDTYGKDTVIIVMVDSSTGEDLISVLERETGKSFSNLQDEWLEFLDEEYKVYEYGQYYQTETPATSGEGEGFLDSLFNSIFSFFGL